MSRTVIGIDLGTTYSLASVLTDGKPVVLPNALGELLTPSAVSVLDDGTVLVGSAARARATTHPDRTALAFKRDMGTDRTYVMGGKQYSPQQLSALVLKQVAHDAGAVLGRPIDEAVVSVPAYFGDAQRQATRDAAELAGLRVERMINEPTAAALAYGLHQRDRELRAVVLDLGGGTFDVTVLQIMEGVIEIQASAGDSRLGGEDFDDALALLALGELDQLTREAVRRESRAWARVKRAAESAKHRLSTDESARVAVPGLQRGQDLERVITQRQAEEAWQPILERMKQPIQRALRDAGVAPAQIEEVLLVGGSTRMPCVGRVAAELFGRIALRTLPPDEAVAMGAAVQAGLKTNDAALGDLVVTDVAPFSLGISTADMSGRSMIAGLFSPIIERGTVIPCSRSKLFHTVENDQTELKIEIYQGEHSLVRDNQLLGTYMMTGLRKARAGEETVEVRFSYDLNGILEVDMTSSAGTTGNLVIEKTPGRLSKAELAAAREALSRLKFHPRDALPNATALARADALYMELVGEPRAILGQILAAFRHALDSQDSAAITRAREELEYALRKLR